MTSWTQLAKILLKKVGLYKQINQAQKSHFVAFFGKDMLDITEQIQPFLVAFIWVMVLDHKIYNLLYDFAFVSIKNFISYLFFYFKKKINNNH